MNNLLLVETDEELLEIQEEVDNSDDSASSFIENSNSNTNVEKKEYVDPYLKYYIGNITIPKINLNKGFTDINSEYNTVNKNVQVVKGSTYPDQKNGNFILAAHSGTSYLAYFKNLYKLEKGDLAYVTYKNMKYTYKIVNIYEQEKTGKIAIYRDVNKTCLTLVTCTKNSKTKQTIYILELENIQNI
jgi:LPXTG-site transpeptidase (sortase) family protein